MTSNEHHLAAMGLPGQLPLPEEPSSHASIWAEEIVNLTIDIFPPLAPQQYVHDRLAVGHGPGRWNGQHFPMDAAAERLSERYHVWTSAVNLGIAEFQRILQSNFPWVPNDSTLYSWLAARLREYKLGLADVRRLLEIAEDLTLANMI
ncbi:hypothetical protein CDV36_002506 [Fusarium kuroshium]|uniref:Uncharacterized protein n=1 Tax=Fusarium kuroshium TaxID=2010991 RepID=A0A3M2SJS1_9HYPO|nr:hypothetical protein CDV36_002506 [Fusarium kuroshium]